jgi:lipid A 3-O-deacylase
MHPLQAQEQDGHVLSFIEENDLLHNPFGKHQDRHYTQGFKLIYLEPGASPSWWVRGSQLARLERALPNVWMDTRGTNFGLVFGQNIYTPENQKATNNVTDDRPYAGWMYIGMAIQRRGATAFDIPVVESFELDLGVIGPEAQGGRSQNAAHQARKLKTFDGWGTELRTEPAFVFKYGRAWKLAFNEESGHYFDLIPDMGVDLGTVRVSANIGATARLGFNLPDDFGVQTIDSAIVLANGKSRGPVGFYIFGQVEGRAIARNAFLDGNLYLNSHHVSKEPFVADLIYGAALTLGQHVELSWTRVERTKEFKGQHGHDRFGSFMAKLKWGF